MIWSKNVSNSKWTDPNYVGIPGISKYKGKNIIQATPALNAFQKFMQTHKFPFAYDTAIGMLRY